MRLFNWANICLFFLALMFVFVILVQFGWAAVETRFVWKTFEEGALETEEVAKLKYPHRIFKQLHELYRQELLSKWGLPTTSVPLNEYTALVWRRSLVRISNLSFRTWFFLSFVILINLVRILFIPWADGLSGNDLAFFNQLTLMSIIGWGMFPSYVLFWVLLQMRIGGIASGSTVLKRNEPASGYIPCGTLKRALEYIQVLVFSYNWYVVIFITGGYRQVMDLTVGWQKAVLLLMFFLPMILFLVSLPWCLHSMALLHTIGAINPKIVLNIFRRIRGEGDEDEDDDDDEEEDVDEAEQELAQIARQLKSGAHSSDRGSLSKGSRAGGKGGAGAPKGMPSAAASSGDAAAGGLRTGMLDGTQDAKQDSRTARRGRRTTTTGTATRRSRTARAAAPRTGKRRARSSSATSTRTGSARSSRRWARSVRTTTRVIPVRLPTRRRRIPRRRGTGKHRRPRASRPPPKARARPAARLVAKPAGKSPRRNRNPRHARPRRAARDAPRGSTPTRSGRTKAASSRSDPARGGRGLFMTTTKKSTRFLKKLDVHCCKKWKLRPKQKKSSRYGNMISLMFRFCCCL